MEILFVRISYYNVFILFLLAGKVSGRHFHYEWLSDGVSEEPFLHLNGNDSSDESCELMYGFLPCSSNVWSHIFLIVIYEYLLYHAESYVGADGRIFSVFGKNFWVAVISQLLDSLPECLILLATGLTTSKEKAQDYVVTGVGLLAGSSILFLTFLWGLCFMFARTKFIVTPGHQIENQGTQLITGSGVVTDGETTFHARFIFLSLIPFLVFQMQFLVFQFPNVFGLWYSSEDYKMMLLLLSISSAICLLLYFKYQSYDPRIWERRVEYAEVERKVHMHVPFYQVQALMSDRETHLMTKEKALKKIFKPSEDNDVKTMTTEEIYEKFEIWFDETRHVLDDPYSMDQLGTKYNQVAELLLEDKIKMIQLLAAMMKHTLGEELHTQDGAWDESYIARAQDESSINRIFQHIDADNDNRITRHELENYIMEMNYNNMPMDNEIAENIMKRFDINGNGVIDQEEFQSGVAKLLKEIHYVASRNQQRQSQDNNQEQDMYHRGEAKEKTKEKCKAIALMILGIIMLLVLAEPLVESVQKFSKSLNIEPFYVSFVLVPIATNARRAITAVRVAHQKRYKSISLTFSEIYHKVFMNNILGFFLLASIVSLRGLKWYFSVEILVVIIVCIIMGLIASFTSKFPTWTVLIVFPLYPLSLFLVYLVSDMFSFTEA